MVYVLHAFLCDVYQLAVNSAGIFVRLLWPGH